MTMNLIILTIVFVISSAAQLPSRNYIPQAQGGQAGEEGYQYNQGGSRGNGNQQARAADQNAQTLKQDQEVNIDGSYNFGYETSNGIRAEEAGDSANVQGGFAYKGDDGNTYTVTYSAGEGGFRAQGEHLPVPPPTPEAILEALKKNEEDEAAGIFDDGQYRADQNEGGQNGGFGSANRQSSFNGNTGYQY